MINNCFLGIRGSSKKKIPISNYQNLNQSRYFHKTNDFIPTPSKMRSHTKHIPIDFLTPRLLYCLNENIKVEMTIQMYKEKNIASYIFTITKCDIKINKFLFHHFYCKTKPYYYTLNTNRHQIFFLIKSMAF